MGEEYDARNEKMTSEFTEDDVTPYCKRFFRVPPSSSTVSLNPWIYKVDERLSDTGDKRFLYEPHIISIGPFHHKKTDLQAMENYKWSYANSLLARAGSVEVKFKECLESVWEVEKEANRFYAEFFQLSKKDFVLMMVIDSLFVIELLSKNVRGADKDDNLLGNPSNRETIARDLLLLENQLPMFVVDRVFKVCMENRGKHTLQELALRFFNPLMPRDKEILKKHFNKTAYHFLDLFYRSFCDDLCLNGNGWKMSWKLFQCIPSSIELRNAGVKLIKCENATSFLDIRFNEGVLEIPPVPVEFQKECIFRNLLAFELYCCGDANYMTSYVCLMSCLIKSTEDLKFLERRGIINETYGNDTLHLFSKLCEKVKLYDFHYLELCSNVNAYTQNHGREWMMKLRRCLKW